MAKTPNTGNLYVTWERNFSEKIKQCAHPRVGRVVGVAEFHRDRYSPIWIRKDTMQSPLLKIIIGIE